MDIRVNQFGIRWLYASSSGAEPSCDESCAPQRVDYNLPPEIGEAWLEAMELGKGFNLYRAVHRLEKANFGEFVPLFDIESAETDFAFSAQIWLSGIGCHREYWGGKRCEPVDILGSPGQDTFRFRKDWAARILVAGGGTSEMRSLVISNAVLGSLVGDSVSAQLLEALGLDKQTETVVLSMPPYVSLPLKDAMSEQYMGQTRRLFAQARALEYLGGLINYVCAADRRPARRHVARIRELKEYLLSLEGRLPTLGELSKDFGLSAKQMNAEFNAEFGQSIFAFVTNHRLDQAHIVLQENDIPMKVVAERLGYSHVNHFITAFKRKHGYPPGALRRRR